MEKEKLKELRKVLIAKIDQLLVLIGDSMKTIHFDYFKINSQNLEEQLPKIRDILKSNPKENLEVLVMKKDVIKLTEDFLKKDLLEELEQEKKKLKKVRYLYLIILFLFVLFGAVLYTGLLTNIFSHLSNTKTKIVYVNKTVNHGKTTSFTGIANKLASNSTGSTITANSGTKLTGNIVVIKKDCPTITGNFLLVKFTKGMVSGNIYSGLIEKVKNLKERQVKLIGFKTGFNTTSLGILKYNNLLTGTKYYVKAELSGTITGNVVIGKIISYKKFIQKPIFDVDINEKILTGEALKEYKQEKKIKCPYSGIIHVSVGALNLRERPTQYSKRILTLRKWTKLNVLTCQKNLKADSWWYKVKLLNKNITGWVSTIGVSK